MDLQGLCQALIRRPLILVYHLRNKQPEEFAEYDDSSSKGSILKATPTSSPQPYIGR